MATRKPVNLEPRQHWHDLWSVEAFTPSMEEVTAKLAIAGFGVTLQEHHLTLRTTRADGVSLTIKLLVNGVEEYVPCCDGCGHPFTPDELDYTYTVEHKVKVVEVICGNCAK